MIRQEFEDLLTVGRYITNAKMIGQNVKIV